MRLKFYQCAQCKNIIIVPKEEVSSICCCGSQMQKLLPGVVDAAVEKHLPVIDKQPQKLTITVGKQPHPMQSEHLIEWIAVETNEGYQVKYLTSEMTPTLEFSLSKEEVPLGAYAYCNLHGLWYQQI